MVERPPLGITPRYIHDERRLLEIREALIRYYVDFRPIPVAWIEEYNELLKRIDVK